MQFDVARNNSWNKFSNLFPGNKKREKDKDKNYKQKNEMKKFQRIRRRIFFIWLCSHPKRNRMNCFKRNFSSSFIFICEIIHEFIVWYWINSLLISWVILYIFFIVKTLYISIIHWWTGFFSTIWTLKFSGKTNPLFKWVVWCCFFTSSQNARITLFIVEIKRTHSKENLSSYCAVELLNI